MSDTLSRPRLPYLLAAALTVAAGLATRPLRRVFPSPTVRLLADGAGDALWSLLVYLLLVLTLPRLPARRAFAAALGVSFAVEVSQLYHAPWIDALRRTTFGALVLGWGFAWTDLVCYTAGCALGVALDRRLRAAAVAAARSSGPIQ